MRKLSDGELDAAARAAGVEGAALRAVIRVETGGRGGFLPDGRVRILFERHLLWKRLRARGIDPTPLARAQPSLCGEAWDPRAYPYGTEPTQWSRVATVAAYGAARGAEASYTEAAWEACSWGMFQLLGENHAGAGYADVRAFKAAQETGEAEQLRAALRWMERAGVLPALRDRDWMRFALRYNGRGQSARYAGLLHTSYERELIA